VQIATDIGRCIDELAASGAELNGNGPKKRVGGVK
jgi:hypothetical protein